MNKTIVVLGLAGLLSTCPLLAFSADKSAGSAAPPSGIPGINQGGSESNTDKADKKGEESSGSNSGAENHETEKDAATSSDSQDIKKAPKP